MTIYHRNRRRARIILFVNGVLGLGILGIVMSHAAAWDAEARAGRIDGYLSLVGKVGFVIQLLKTLVLVYRLRRYEARFRAIRKSEDVENFSPTYDLVLTGTDLDTEIQAVGLILSVCVALDLLFLFFFFVVCGLHVWGPGFLVVACNLAGSVFLYADLLHHCSWDQLVKTVVLVFTDDRAPGPDADRYE
jgi:hypothetical protein